MRKIPGFELAMGAGVLILVGYRLYERTPGHVELLGALAALLAGVLMLAGACELLVRAVEGMAALLNWDEFMGGTVAEIVDTLPELVVIVLVVRVSPITAFTIALVAIYNNSLVFSIYSYFLPKDRKGRFVMPTAVTRAGTEVLIAGSGIALVFGLVMLALQQEAHKTQFSAADLLFLAVVMLAIFGWYLHTLMRYYATDPHAREHAETAPRPGEEHANWRAILTYGLFGVAGTMLGGESVSHFAETALEQLHLTDVQTAVILAGFAGMSEYVIVYKAHKRREYGLALSNVFGGITQLMFLVFPFTLLVVGFFMLGGIAKEVIPINFTTTILICLLFPVFFVLFELIETDHTLNNLDATAMTGIYAIIIYVLLFYSGAQ